MSLLKRRSRSETRKFELNEKTASSSQDKREQVQLAKVKSQHGQQKSQTNLNQLGRQHLEMMRSDMGRRKTSAELISEAKTHLGNVGSHHHGGGTNQIASVGGVRLVSTRRPITPREPGRALYGKVALAGRPPSAFSLRYLQNEGNRTPMMPSLEPIQNKGSLEVNTNDVTTQQRSRRSHSLESRLECYEVGGGGGNVVGVQTKVVPRKLPALEIKGVSLEVKGNDKVTANDLHKERSKTAKNPKSMPNESTSLDTNGSNKSINLLTSRKLFTRNYDLLGQSTTEKLVELLKEHAGLKDCTEETVNHISAILVELYGRVRKNEKSFKRGFILGGLYGLVECSSPKILLAVARVVLALRVTGSNLTGACKLIFKVSRNEQNDYLFHDNDLLESLIDGLGRASPLDDPEACIYGYGSIRFLTSSMGQERAEASVIRDGNKNWSDCLELPRKPSTAPAQGSGGIKSSFELLQLERYQKLSKQNSLVERLARHGAVELMVLHLQILNEVGATEKLTGPPLHSLYQLSAALRTLADVRQTSCSFENDLDMEQTNRIGSEGNIQLELACPHLIRAAEVSTGELEVQANIVRTLSVLSEDNDCCHVLVNFTARIGMLLGPCCEMFGGSSEKLLSLLSRLGYILGNIMAKYDNARVQFYHNDVAMEYLLNVLELYSKEPLTLHNSLGDTVIDVLIKMIRVVANMSVNSEVGFGLGNTRALGAILLNLLNVTNQVQTVKMKLEQQELVHATLGALHNLCFYQDQNTTPAQVIESKGSLQSILSDLASALCVTLRTTKEESTQVETARVLGNLTRNEKARKYYCRAGGLPVIVQRLSNNSSCQDYDLKACAIGVLVNLLGEWENRLPFAQLKGVEMLLMLLKSALQQEDWFLAAIICQAFWNLLIDTQRVVDICEERELDDICELLADYLDEERLFDSNANADALWEEFAVVATDLLERMQANFEKQNEELAFSSEDSENDGDDDDVYIEEM